MSHVLFVCIQNAARSQMAHALFERAASGYEARSAGSRPAGRVHPEVVEAMREPDVDLSDRTPHRLDREDIERRVADLAADLPAG
jgi:arsenate reductase